MFNTRVCKELGIKYPIIQGGMMWVSTAKLSGAVSNAGGLGIITALTFDSPKGLEQEIKKLREITDKPFGVNVTLLPTLKPINYDDYIDVIVNEDVKIVETAGYNPEKYINRLKKKDIKIIHKCTSIRHAKKAESIGCDFISIDGFECAGHPGEDDVTSLILVPRAVDELNIPVIASGGFGDARGFLAALALGAEGVNMGTRFFVTKEAPVHDNIKKAIVNATERDTILLLRSLKNTMRVLKNEHAKKVYELEEKKVPFEELAPLLSGLKGKEAFENGDTNSSLIACGQIAGLIKDIPSVAKLIDNIINEAKKISNNILKE
ncbi:MAG: nitronate monooxygenase [Deferribacterota bacterium]|nr:nitronate monooxygenase [Deferribacterota bacterium]